MRVNHEMNTIRTRVRDKTMDGFGFTASPGCFMLNGDQLSRKSIRNASSHETSKVLQCGTCGIVLSTEEVAHCVKCKQMKIDKDTWIGTLVDDWQKRKVSIQYEPPEWERRRIKRMNKTDDVSSVTSGDLSYREECEKAYLQMPLSRSDRREPSTHKVSHPGHPDQSYHKFLSGFGMQEPWERVYSQGERLWLPSRVGIKRSSNIANGSVRLPGSPSKGVTLRQFGGGQDRPHAVHRATNPSAGMRFPKTPL
jgi:hypothetical protein